MRGTKRVKRASTGAGSGSTTGRGACVYGWEMCPLTLYKTLRNEAICAQCENWCAVRI